MIQITMIQYVSMPDYNLKEKSHDGYIFTQLTKGMYGLPQAGRISNDTLVKHMEHYGHRPFSKTPGLWSHDSLPINVTLVVNYFRAKYLKKNMCYI